MTDDPRFFTYKGVEYPDLIRNGNGMQYVAPIALQFCRGKGLDVGCGDWCLPGAMPWDASNFKFAAALPDEKFDYIFSSHMLEHMVSPVNTIEHFKTRLREGGVLFLYLPHPDMVYWRPENNRKHLHLLWPKDVAAMLTELGFSHVHHSERDLAFGFSVVGVNGAEHE